MFSRHQHNLRPTPSFCELGQSTMNRMKSLQLEQLSDHIFGSSMWYLKPCPGIRGRCCGAAMSTAPSASWCACPLSSCVPCSSAYSISYVDDRPRDLQLRQRTLKPAPSDF